MMKYLRIQNIALICSLEIEFDKGLIVLSGETGAGKSIIVDSLSFVLGERADKTLIKFGEESAFVEVVFQISEQDKAYSVLQELGFEPDTTIVISRVLNLSGKNECRVNGRVCATSTLKQISSSLVDIFGQSQHLNLIKVDNHLVVLDDFMGETEENTQLLSLNRSLKDVKAQLNSFGGSDSERIRLLDILSFQINEIKSAKLDVNEEEELLQQHSRIVNMEKIVTNLTTAVDCFDMGVNSNVGSAISALTSISSYDKNINSLLERLQSAQIELDDISATLTDMLRSSDFDPSSAEQTEARLEHIKTIKRKYGGTVQSALDFLDKASTQYDNLLNATEKIQDLTRQKDKIIQQMYDLSLSLSQKRKKSAQQFATEIQSQLSDLGMAGATFCVSFNDTPDLTSYADVAGSNGFDKVEFLFSANKGEPNKPLAKIISGGEMSRFMLAIKNITARIEQIPTMVFDEIDTGISGSMAQMVAQKLANVSKSYQCIVITHLPQIAAMADVNLLISKSVVNGRTLSQLTVLDQEQTTQEVARLMGGANIGQFSLLHAKEMIDWANDYKKTSSH